MDDVAFDILSALDAEKDANKFGVPFTWVRPKAVTLTELFKKAEQPAADSPPWKGGTLTANADSTLSNKLIIIDPNAYCIGLQQISEPLRVTEGTSLKIGVTNPEVRKATGDKRVISVIKNAPVTSDESSYADKQIAHAVATKGAAAPSRPAIGRLSTSLGGIRDGIMGRLHMSGATLSHPGS
jgi:hypothetical protein